MSETSSSAVSVCQSKVNSRKIMLDCFVCSPARRHRRRQCPRRAQARRRARFALRARLQRYIVARSQRLGCVCTRQTQQKQREEAVYMHYLHSERAFITSWHGLNAEAVETQRKGSVLVKSRHGLSVTKRRGEREAGERGQAKRSEESWTHSALSCFSTAFAAETVPLSCAPTAFRW